MFSVKLITKNLELTEELKELTNKKFRKLEKWLMNFPADALTATVLLKKRVHQSKDNIYTTKITLAIPSTMFHAHKEGYTLEESLIGAVSDIEDQLGKHQAKLNHY